MSDDLDGIKNLWIILNSILVLYAIILLIYGKYFRNKDSLSIVTHNFLNIFIQKNIAVDNKGTFGRADDSIRNIENKELDDKKINLIETK